MEKIIFEDLPSTKTPINATNLNQLQTNVENAISAIVESGSNINGSWIKFEDGTMIWWGSITLETIEITNSFGSLYRTAGNTYGNVGFGISFKEKPKIFASLSGNYNAWLSTVGKNATATETGTIMLVSATNEVVWEETISYLAIGKWK